MLYPQISYYFLEYGFLLSSIITELSAVIGLNRFDFELLAKAAHLKGDTRAMMPEAIMAALGQPGVVAEGRFFPDTYHYARGSSDLKQHHQPKPARQH